MLQLLKNDLPMKKNLELKKLSSDELQPNLVASSSTRWQHCSRIKIAPLVLQSDHAFKKKNCTAFFLAPVLSTDE